MSVSEKLADAATESLSAVAKDLYQDLLQPTMQNLGLAFGTVSDTVNTVLFPLFLVNTNRRERMRAALEPKIEKIPQESLVAPPEMLSFSALQYMALSIDEPDLRELYANLLATSMDARAAHTALPSFVEVIKQLSPDEAKLFKYMGTGAPLPVISLWPVGESSGRYVLEYFSLLGESAQCDHPDVAPVYIANLCRLNLVVVPNDICYKNAEAYKALEADPRIRELCTRNGHETWQSWMPWVDYRMVQITPFGAQFHAVCLGGECAPDCSPVKPKPMVAAQIGGAAYKSVKDRLARDFERSARLV